MLRILIFLPFLTLCAFQLSASFFALPHCLGTVGSGSPAVHYLIAGGSGWVVELLLCTASMPGGSGQWNSLCALPHWVGALGSGSCAVHCLAAEGQWAMELWHTASVPGGQWAVELVM